jgi:hypothetical protein
MADGTGHELKKGPLKRAAKAAKQDEKDGVHKIDEDRDNT